MGRRLYVGNLAWTVTDQDLRDVFSEAGNVDSSQVIMDRATNRSRGRTGGGGGAGGGMRSSAANR